MLVVPWIPAPGLELRSTGRRRVRPERSRIPLGARAPPWAARPESACRSPRATPCRPPAEHARPRCVHRATPARDLIREYPGRSRAITCAARHRIGVGLVGPGPTPRAGGPPGGPGRRMTLATTVTGDLRTRHGSDSTRSAPRIRRRPSTPSAIPGDLLPVRPGRHDPTSSRSDPDRATKTAATRASLPPPAPLRHVHATAPAHRRALDPLKPTRSPASHRPATGRPTTACPLGRPASPAPTLRRRVLAAPILPPALLVDTPSPTIIMINPDQWDQGVLASVQGCRRVASSTTNPTSWTRWWSTRTWRPPLHRSGRWPDQWKSCATPTRSPAATRSHAPSAAWANRWIGTGSPTTSRRHADYRERLNVLAADLHRLTRRPVCRADDQRLRCTPALPALRRPPPHAVPTRAC